jgi:hypothetical protein
MLAKPETLVLAILAGRSCRRALERVWSLAVPPFTSLSSGFVHASRTLESSLDQTLRAQSRGIIGTQFRFALRAVWHFGPEAVTSSPAIPYSWQVSRIRTGRLMDKPKRRFSMKTITRFNIYLPMAAMILTAVLAVPAAAQQQVPFKGTFQGTDTPAPSAPPLQSITGNGTLLGQFSSTPPVSGSPGSAHWIAANGDSIDTTYVGSLVGHVDMAPCQVVDAQPEDSYAEIKQIHTITGGTGRFAGVQGSFILTKYHDLVLRNGTNGTCGSYSGTITPPGAAH